MLLVMSNLFKLILFLPIILACNKSENQSGASYIETEEASDEGSHKANESEPNAMNFEVKKEVVTAEKQVSIILKEGAIKGIPQRQSGDFGLSYQIWCLFGFRE